MDNAPASEYLSCRAVRNVDRYAIDVLGMDGLVLMENAARGCADLLETAGINGPVAVICGKGNNGGDGFAIARHLLVRNYDVSAILVGDPQELTGDARANFGYLKKIAPQRTHGVFSFEKPGTQQQISKMISPEADWIVDAILGTGTQGQIKEPFSSAIKAINACCARVFAVDIPSGLDGDSGESLGTTIQATITGTFVRKKLGFKNQGAEHFLGDVHVLDIGVPDSTVDNAIGDMT